MFSDGCVGSATELIRARQTVPVVFAGAEEEHGLPCVDPVRTGVAPIVDAMGLAPALEGAA